MIEPEDTGPFKIFVKAICGHACYCGRFITGCRACLQRNGVTIVDDETASEFTNVETYPEMLMSVHC